MSTIWSGTTTPRRSYWPLRGSTAAWASCGIATSRQERAQPGLGPSHKGPLLKYRLFHLVITRALLRCVSCSERISGPRALTPNIGSYVQPASTHSFARSSRVTCTTRRLDCARNRLSGEPGASIGLSPRATESWPRGSTGAARQPSVRPYTPWWRTELDRKHNYLDSTEPN
jgi:hypothetical protein